jgi:hypothetical protein
MRKTIINLILTAILILTFFSSAHSQPVWNGDYTITTAADIAALSSYTEITGNLIIEDTILTSLTGLENITTVGGTLFIFHNDAITNLSGLDNLTNLGRNLTITHNPSLTNLTGLEGLTSINLDFYIYDNDALTSLSGLENISSVERNLVILYNASLTNLTGLEGLTSVSEGLYIYDNNALSSLNGLENITSVGRDLWIFNNERLFNLCGLYNINLSGTELKIYSNETLSMDTAYALEDRLRSKGFTGTADIHDNNGTGLVTCETLIELSSFNAISANGRVTLRWTTASEIDNAGFNIYRSDSKDGDYEQINDSLIAAEGSATEGSVYKFIDVDVENRTKYLYMLEDVDLNGVSTMHGPVSGTPRLIYEIIK